MIEMGNLSLVLSEAQVPLCHRTYYVSPVPVLDEELDHYVAMALDLM